MSDDAAPADMRNVGHAHSGKRTSPPPRVVSDGALVVVHPRRRPQDALWTAVNAIARVHHVRSAQRAGRRRLRAGGGDGRTWTRMPSPTPPGQVVALFAVSAVSATDVWAVGRDLTATTGKTLVLHWDGRAWTQVSSPSPGATDNQLLGVHMTTATDGWAVGLTTNSLAQDLTLVLHWDGAAWTQVSSPSFGLSNGGSQLTAVSALAGSDAWASGLVFTNGGGEGTLLLHWDGASWTRVAAPSPSPGGATGGSFLDGVHMTATADVWSAGGTFFDSTGREQTLLLHWNGKTWTRF